MSAIRCKLKLIEIWINIIHVYLFGDKRTKLQESCGKLRGFQCAGTSKPFNIYSMSLLPLGLWQILDFSSDVIQQSLVSLLRHKTNTSS